MTRSLPNSRVAEQAILTYILLNKPESNIIFNKISSDMFYSTDYKIIYQSACNLKSKNLEVNFDTVHNSLGDDESFEIDSTLTDLINQPIRFGELDTYIILLIDKYLRRNLILSAQNVSKLAEDNSLSLENIFDQAEQLLFDVTQKKPNLGLLPASEVLLETFLDLEQRSKEGQLAGIPSGFFDLDMLTQGFQKSDLIIVAGRPSMGKTAFALNIARNAADLQASPVVIFSLEMSRSQIIYRFLSNESGINNSKLRSGEITSNEWKSVSRAISSLSGLNIYLDDKSDITISDIRIKLNSLRSRFGSIGLVIIDYLQLISDFRSNDSRVQELSRITRNLKLLSKEFNVPIIVLSQLSRSVESRVNKRPLLSDLRESGCFATSVNLYKSFQKTINLSADLRLKNKISSLVSVKQTQKILYPSLSKVKSLFATGLNFTYELLAVGHFHIRLTKNHKILTQHGWKKVEHLSMTHLIAAIDKYNFSINSIHFYNLKLVSYFTFLQLNNILPFGREIVYDCWLPLTNNFLADGYILHNSIEQDADLVLMIYREQYYENDDKNKNVADITIAKHRNGPVGTINLFFDSSTASFGNIIN
jgi:replicative DNA helicase